MINSVYLMYLAKLSSLTPTPPQDLSLPLFSSLSGLGHPQRTTPYPFHLTIFNLLSPRLSYFLCICLVKNIARLTSVLGESLA